ncbi:MAG TPA: hypothetical protein VFU50_07410 [Terriglobales bacterium]|nr:hypothetical protein [Terriglobales bacterium]
MGNPRFIRMAANICLCALSSAGPLHAGGKQEASPAWVLHKQKVQAEKLDLRPAEQPCANWGWVAVVSDMAAARGIHISQQYLIDRLYGGSRCLDAVADSEALAKAISHDYVLQDGQQFGLQARFTPGAPVQADPLIVSVRQNRPLMLLWRNHPFLLTGLTYDEYIAETGNKMFVVTELQLFDPLGEPGKRTVVFSRDQDSPDDINGVLDLVVYTK